MAVKFFVLLTNLYIFVTILNWQARTSNALSCSSCNPQSCVKPTCTGGIARDHCGCCQICAKLENEKCGGSFDIHGRCDKNLTCVLQPNHGHLLTGSEEGICKSTTSLTSSDRCRETAYIGCDLVGMHCECKQQVACSNPFTFDTRKQCNQFLKKSKKKCVDVRCSVQQSPSCPQDSVLVEGFVPKGQCCPLPSRCECQPKHCAYSLCPPNTRRMLVKESRNRPGSCCDIYQCVPDEAKDDCSAVRCALHSLDSINCPSDSVAIIDPHSKSKCCPGNPICQCRPNVCNRPTCPSHTKTKVAYRANGKPGSCCDVYKCTNDNLLVGCSVNGTKYPHGSKYRLENCRDCECKMGVSYCAPVVCPKLRCTRVTLDAGACCPKCIDESDSVDLPYPRPLCSSDDNQRAYSVGETWSTDPCTHCECVEGGVTRCRAAFCQEPSTTVITPTCPSLSNCSLADSDCSYGFKYDEQGCRVCRCNSRAHGCPSLDKCTNDCPRGHAYDESGCETCKCRQRKCKDLSTCFKQCPYGYRQNKKGCDRCKCRRCPPMDVCDKLCRHGLRVNKYGCTMCKCRDKAGSVEPEDDHPTHTCVDAQTGKRHDDGETWSSDCYICVCRGGDVMCDVIKCPIPNCDNPEIKEGYCCATCPGNNAATPLVPRSLSCLKPDGDWFVEGETWVVDKCTTCTCHSGHVMCTSNQCPPTPCENPIFDEKLCCPKCPDPRNSIEKPQPSKTVCHTKSGHINNGKTYRSLPCTSCICQSGEIKCFNEKCPQILPCDNPVLRRGQCCPLCLGQTVALSSCNIRGQIRKHDEVWNNTADACETCTCAEGKVTCVSPQCAPLPPKCRRIYRRPKACCDECVLIGSGHHDPAQPPSDQPEKDWLWLGLLIAAVSAIIIAIIIVLVVLIQRRFFTRTRGQYTPGSVSSTPSNTIVKCSSLRSGSTGTARTMVFSTSSEEDHSSLDRVN